MIAIGSDHAGLRLKQAAIQHLEERGFEIQDHGTRDSSSCDYPDYALSVGRAVVAAEAERGLLICGTGTGMAIAANKLAGVRAAMCCSELQARMARSHNDANVLCLGERLQGEGLALAIVDAFFDSEFEGGRHALRVAKITEAEG